MSLKQEQFSKPLILVSTLLFAIYFIYINIVCFSSENISLMFVSLSGIVLVIQGLIQFQRLADMKNWPFVDGKVVSNSIAEFTHFEDTGKIVFYYPNIQYVYYVNDQKFNSSSFSMDKYSIKSQDKCEIDIITSKYVINSHVKVYYNKKNPEISVLNKTVPFQTKMIYLTKVFSGLVLLILENFVRNL